MTMKADFVAVPDGALATTPSADNLAISLEEMLNAYWWDDGYAPPAFVQQAILLVEAHKRAKGQPMPSWSFVRRGA
jgi:hypothetical protein